MVNSTIQLLECYKGFTSFVKTNVLNLIKRLAGQTLVYGVSTILVRLINYALAPFHTRIFEDTSDFGLITIFYSYAAFLNILFMYGMETAFFRFSTHEQNSKEDVLKTSQGLLIITTLLFTSLIWIFSDAISAFIGYPGYSTWVKILSLIILFDTLSNIPFAYLRLQNQAFKYVGVKLMNVLVNVGLNFVLIILLVNHTEYLSQWSVYLGSKPLISVVFICNLIASIVTFLCLLPHSLRISFRPDMNLLISMLKYGTPLIIVGLAGMVNEVFDRLLLKKFLPGSPQFVDAQIGIYSGCYKLGIFMNIAVQAFRMGAEPFFFKESKNVESKKLYADVMLYFSIFTLFIFLLVALFLQTISYIIGPNYRSGLYIVPWLLMAYFFLGLSYQFSTWYKLSGKTLFATVFSIIAAVVTIVSTIVLAKSIGILAGAIGTLLGYITMTMLGYIAGQRYYPIPYPVAKVGLYMIIVLMLYFVGYWLQSEIDSFILQIIFNLLIVFSFVVVVAFLEKNRWIHRVSKRK